MKKKILLISSVLLTFCLILVVTINNMGNLEKNIISNSEKEKQVISSNMITMMYETEAGSKEYVETKDNTWPKSGYIFNDTLSGCENGGELKYNSENNTVNLLSNKSDRCYVYFDKYNGVWIDNVSITNVTGSSVTLSVSATSENGSITKYYYSLNDSEEYQEVTSNVITINNLNKLTEYKISIYAIDNTNAKSNIYELSVNTTDESGPVINFALINEITSDSISLTLQVESKNEISNYYYSSNGGASYVSNNNNTYTFSGLNKNTDYNISIYVEDNTGQKSNIYTFKITTENSLTLAEYIINNVYVEDGVNDLYYHDGKGNYTNADQEAGDNAYRYSGLDPNNYIEFGSELYRIIGIFDGEIKIIKNDRLGDYPWSGYTSQYVNGGWGNNHLKDILNSDYFSKITPTWQNKVLIHNWKVGGMTLSQGVETIKNVYKYELGTSSKSKTYSGQLGLMYVSDYGYAASPDLWKTKLNYYDGSNNWLSYLNVYRKAEWTITVVSDNQGWAFDIFTDGGITRHSITDQFFVRPCFYLDSNVLYFTGDGTKSTPYQIKVN